MWGSFFCSNYYQKQTQNLRAEYRHVHETCIVQHAATLYKIASEEQKHPSHYCKILSFLTVDTQLLKLRLFVLVFLHGREEFFIVICFNLFFFYTVAKKSNFENISKPIAPDAV